MEEDCGCKAMQQIAVYRIFLKDTYSNIHTYISSMGIQKYD
jgi:hypothetical protein